MSELPKAFGKLTPERALGVLSDASDPGFAGLWSEFFLNVDAVKLLLPVVVEEEAKTLLSAALSWNGSGWTTSRAAKTLHETTGVPLVKAEFLEYLGAFVFALTLVFGLAIGTLTLSNQAATAAFAFASVVGSQNPPPHQPFDTGEEFPVDSDWQETTSDDENLLWEWEAEPTPLPTPLPALWLRGKNGPKMDLKTVLKQLPAYKELPQEAPRNNPLGDGIANLDRQLLLMKPRWWTEVLSR